jgi:hypothetical protein
VAVRRDPTEQRLRGKFRNWLIDLEDDQLAALDENWDNIMGDAALDRIDRGSDHTVSVTREREKDHDGR